MVLVTTWYNAQHLTAEQIAQLDAGLRADLAEMDNEPDPDPEPEAEL
jgi:hypothetical protein